MDLRIFQKIALNFKVVSRFRPYFQKQERELLSFDLVDNDVDARIRAIYGLMELQGLNKYKNDKKRYGTYLENKLSHNKDVEFVSKVVNHWKSMLFLAILMRLTRKT